MLINEIHFNRNGRNYCLMQIGSDIRLQQLRADLNVAQEWRFPIGQPIFKTFAEIGTIVFRTPGGDTPVTLDESSSMTTVANVAQLLEMVRQIGNFS